MRDVLYIFLKMLWGSIFLWEKVVIVDVEELGCLCKFCMLFLWRVFYFLGELGSGFMKMYWIIRIVKEVMCFG